MGSALEAPWSTLRRLLHVLLPGASLHRSKLGFAKQHAQRQDLGPAAQQHTTMIHWSTMKFRHGCGKMQGLFDLSRWLWWLWWHSFILFRGSDLFGDLRFDNFCCCWLLSALEEWWKSSSRQRSDSMLMKSGQIRLVRGQSESHWELVNQLVLECDWHTLFYILKC